MKLGSSAVASTIAVVFIGSSIAAAFPASANPLIWFMRLAAPRAAGAAVRSIPSLVGRQVVKEVVRQGVSHALTPYQAPPPPMVQPIDVASPAVSSFPLNPSLFQIMTPDGRVLNTIHPVMTAPQVVQTQVAALRAAPIAPPVITPVWAPPPQAFQVVAPDGRILNTISPNPTVFPQPSFVVARPQTISPASLQRIGPDGRVYNVIR